MYILSIISEYIDSYVILLYDAYCAIRYTPVRVQWNTPYRQRDNSQKLTKSLSYAVLTFIDLYNTKVVTVFFLRMYIDQYMT